MEAIAISEVYALADQHPQAQIIMTHDIDPERAKAIQAPLSDYVFEIQRHGVDIVWELLNLKGASIQ